MWMNVIINHKYLNNIKNIYKINYKYLNNINKKKDHVTISKKTKQIIGITGIKIKILNEITCFYNILADSIHQLINC